MLLSVDIFNSLASASASHFHLITSSSTLRTQHLLGNGIHQKVGMAEETQWQGELPTEDPWEPLYNFLSSLRAGYWQHNEVTSPAAFELQQAQEEQGAEEADQPSPDKPGRSCARPLLLPLCPCGSSRTLCWKSSLKNTSPSKSQARACCAWNIWKGFMMR